MVVAVVKVQTPAVGLQRPYFWTDVQAPKESRRPCARGERDVVCVEPSSVVNRVIRPAGRIRLDEVGKLFWVVDVMALQPPKIPPRRTLMDRKTLSSWTAEATSAWIAPFGDGLE